MRVLQLRGELNLLQKSLRAECLRQLGFEDLERHLTIVLEIVSEVDGRHTAVTERPLKPIAIGESGGDQLELCGGFAHGDALLERRDGRREWRIFARLRQEASRRAHCFSLVNLAVNDRTQLAPPSFEYDSSYWCESALMSDHTARTRIVLSYTELS